MKCLYVLIFLALTALCLPTNGATDDDDASEKYGYHRSSEMLTRGVYADQDPFDKRRGHGGRVFQFTYKQGNGYADQVTPDFALPNYRTHPAIIESLPQLQNLANDTFSINFLVNLDQSLGTQALGLANMSPKLINSFTFGYTYSNEYKYQRNQIEKAKMIIYRLKYDYKKYQFWLNSPESTLSPEFTADLQKTMANQTASAHASALVAKYGSLFIQGGIFGSSCCQDDFIPQHFYSLTDWSTNLNAELYFTTGNVQFGQLLLSEMRKKTSIPYYRRTSRIFRGGYIPPTNPTVKCYLLLAKNRPEIIRFFFAPLSNLITADLALKREVAPIVRRQLLRSVALNFLDINLFPEKALQQGENVFPNIKQYAKKTQKQLTEMVASNGNRLISPFFKMNAIAQALEYLDLLSQYHLIDLNSTEIEKTYSQIRKCNSKQLESIKPFTEAALEKVHQALENVLKAGAALDEQWFRLFTDWSDGNENLIKSLEKYKKEIEKVKAAFKTVDSTFSDNIGLSMPEFFSECFE